MIEFIVQYYDEISKEWVDARTAFNYEEAIVKENEVKQTGNKTKIITVKEKNEKEDEQPSQTTKGT